MSGFCGCPSSQPIDFGKDDSQEKPAEGRVASQLRQWPIQLHLVSPAAPYFQESDVILAADCVPFAMGNFHGDYLKGKSLAIACPKLDSNQESYVEKIKGLCEEAKINTLTVMIMQVPCCRGLLSTAMEAVKRSSRKVPVKYVVVGLQGDVLQEDWVEA